MITTDGVKFCRQKIDRLIDGVGKLQKSREVSLAFTNAQRSKSFLGLVLKDMSAPNPYPDSSDKDSKKIEPQADRAAMPYNFESTEHLAMVKEMRADFENVIEEIKDLYFRAQDTKIEPKNQPFFPTHLIVSLTALEEAKMWLGWELDRIRDEQK